MHSEMIQEYEDTMTAFGEIDCATEILEKEQYIYSAWADFKPWMRATNDATKSAAYVKTMKNLFLGDCTENRCHDAPRFLLNGLAPKGSFPYIKCDYMEAFYRSSGIAGYVGYRDYIATKSAVLFLEATLSLIMETVNINEEEPDLTPKEAPGVIVDEFGSWTVDAAKRIEAYIDKAYN